MSNQEDPALEQALQMMAAKNHPAMRSPNGGKVFLSLCAGLLCPGLGHVLAGYYTRAIVWFVVVSGLFGAMLVGFLEPRYVTILPLAVPLAVLGQICHLVDAAVCAVRSRTSMLAESSIRYIVAVMLVMISFFLQHEATNYLLTDCFEICYTPTSSMAPTVGTSDWFLDRRGAPFAAGTLSWRIPPFPTSRKFSNG